MTADSRRHIVRIDDLRGRGLVAWMVLGPLAAIVLLAAVAMRPSRDASCNAALPCEEDLVSTESSE